MATRLLRADEVKLVKLKYKQLQPHLKNHPQLLKDLNEYFEEAFRQNDDGLLTENSEEEWVNGFSLRHGAFSVTGTLGELMTFIGAQQRGIKLNFCFDKDQQVQGIDFLGPMAETYSVKLAEIPEMIGDTPCRSIFLNSLVASRMLVEEVDYFSLIDIKTNLNVIIPAVNAIRGIAKAQSNQKQSMNRSRLMVFYDQFGIKPDESRFKVEL